MGQEQPSANGIGKTGPLMNSKWIKDKHRVKTIKLEESISDELLDIGLGSGFFGFDTKSKDTGVGLY